MRCVGTDPIKLNIESVALWTDHDFQIRGGRGGEIENKRRSILQPNTSTITEVHQQFCFSIHGKK